jgi:hypothetical protein
MYSYHEPNDPQRPPLICFAIVRRTTYGKSDSRRELTFENGDLYWVATYRAAQDCLRAILRSKVYKAGIYICIGPDGREFLKFFLFPDFSKVPDSLSVLEVAR